MKRLVKNIIKIILIILILICLLACFLLYKGHENYIVLTKDRPISEMRNEIMNNTDNYVLSNKISYAVKNSIVAIEDHRFYTNKGVDLISVIRALVSTFIYNNPQGGSTITMQLSKNYYYEDMSANIIRKFSEVYFAYDIEAHYSKDEILEMYLNLIYYGDGYIGIYDACNGYFDRSPLMMDYGRATLLAGIINAPSVYQLSTGGTKALQRQTRVINALYTYNFIDKAERDTLLNENRQYKEIYGY